MSYKKIFLITLFILMTGSVLFGDSKTKSIKIPEKFIGVYVPQERCEVANGSVISGSCINFEPMVAFVITESGMSKMPGEPFYKLKSISKAVISEKEWFTLVFESSTNQEESINLSQIDESNWMSQGKKENSTDNTNFYLLSLRKFPLDALE